MDPEIRSVRRVTVTRDHYDLVRTCCGLHAFADGLAVLNPADNRGVTKFFAPTITHVVQAQSRPIRGRVEDISRSKVDTVDVVVNSVALHDTFDHHAVTLKARRIRGDLLYGGPFRNKCRTLFWNCREFLVRKEVCGEGQARHRHDYRTPGSKYVRFHPRTPPRADRSVCED